MKQRNGFASPRPRKADRRFAADYWNSTRLLPDLPPAEYESLKQSIAAKGVGVPILVDQHGKIIDGWHRERACRELGTYCPREIRHFASDSERLQVAVSLNLNRRHLDRAQRREIIAALLKADPAINDNHLGQIVGVSKNTVASVRADLESTCQIDKLEQRRGRDGKDRPAKYRRIITSTANETEKALAVMSGVQAAEKPVDWDQTPEEVCREIIGLIPWAEGELVLEPFRGQGSFYNNLPDSIRKDWCEIKEGRDFFQYEGQPSTIISNPPFRNEAGGDNLVVPCLERSLNIATKRVVFFINHKSLNSLTAARLTKYEGWGWGITHFSVWDTKKWFGRYYLVIFEKHMPSIIGFFAANEQYNVEDVGAEDDQSVTLT